jgi:hypothetical protein
MRLYFLRVGVPKSVLDKCIARSKWQSGEAVAANLRIKCRYTDFADRIGYEIFVERTDQSQPVVGSRWDPLGEAHTFMPPLLARADKVIK